MGVVVKADSIGSLEAIARLFEHHGIPIKSAGVGNVTRRDILEAEAVAGKDRYLGVVFAFNASVLKESEAEAEEAGVKVFADNSPGCCSSIPPGMRHSQRSGSAGGALLTLPCCLLTSMRGYSRRP